MVTNLSAGKGWAHSPGGLRSTELLPSSSEAPKSNPAPSWEALQVHHLQAHAWDPPSLPSFGQASFYPPYYSQAAKTEETMNGLFLRRRQPHHITWPHPYPPLGHRAMATGQHLRTARHHFPGGFGTQSQWTPLSKKHEEY